MLFLIGTILLFCIIYKDIDSPLVFKFGMAYLFFTFFGSLNYGYDYFFRPSKIDLLREFSIAFGSAFGLSFIDVTFLKKKED